MKWTNMLKGKLTGLTDAIARFPLTTMFLILAAITNGYGINTNEDVSRFLLTFVVGAFLSAVSQVAYERFFTKSSVRFGLKAVVLLLAGGYYWIIQDSSDYSTDILIRTIVALFALLIAFIWVPVIKSKISFNQSFMISFKSIFNSLFFSGVIFGGIFIILAAVDQLIFEIDAKAYPHSANLVFIIFATMYFLSLIPVYIGKNGEQGKNDQQIKKIESAASCPKFLQVLISYILIPILAVFTFILVIYIVKNIGGEFWTDNLLEPMLVSYAISVILVYILGSEIHNKFTIFFRKGFPKVLVLIVLFQIASSFLSLADTGITHPKYYVILFGIFAVVAGILFSFLPVRKNGIIAAVLIVFATISIVPPVDSFTVSRTSQTNRLEAVLVENNMLENNRIVPNDSISDEDKETIVNAVQYLSNMDYIKKIEWLPQQLDLYNHFEQTFGFQPYGNHGNHPQPIYLSVDKFAPINIEGFDIFVQSEIYLEELYKGVKICDFEKAGQPYTLVKDLKANEVYINILAENDTEILSFNTQEIFEKFSSYDEMKGQISIEDATFSKENDRAEISIIVQNINIEKSIKQYNNAVLFILVKIK